MTAKNSAVLVARASKIVEHRDCGLEVAAAEVRAAANGAATFVGHASVFNSRTAIGNPLSWGFYEEIDPGAFDKTLQEADARFLVDHDSRLLVARKSADDLRLSVDSVGLAVEADLDTELSYVRDLVRNLEKRRITGMSFGFNVIRDEWTVEQVETSDGNTADVEVRRILEVRLIEVSAVTFPAYQDTDAAVRSMVAEVRADRLNTITAGEIKASTLAANSVSEILVNRLNEADSKRCEGCGADIELPTSPKSDSPAPVDEATRSDNDSTPTDEVTSDLAELQSRALRLRSRVVEVKRA